MRCFKTVDFRPDTNFPLSSLGTTSLIARRKSARCCMLSWSREEMFASSNTVMSLSLQQLPNSSRSCCFSRPDPSLSCLYQRNDLLGFLFVNGITPKNFTSRIDVISPDATSLRILAKWNYLCASLSVTLLSSLECFGNSLMNASSRRIVSRIVVS